MKCAECYWCSLDHTLSDEAVCCNEKSEYYNQIFPKPEREVRGCDDWQTKKEVDYINMTPWEFASRYYM